MSDFFEIFDDANVEWEEAKEDAKSSWNHIRCNGIRIFARENGSDERIDDGGDNTIADTLDEITEYSLGQVVKHYTTHYADKELWFQLYGDFDGADEERDFDEYMYQPQVSEWDGQIVFDKNLNIIKERK